MSAITERSDMGRRDPFGVPIYTLNGDLTKFIFSYHFFIIFFLTGLKDSNSITGFYGKDQFAV